MRVLILVLVAFGFAFDALGCESGCDSTSQNPSFAQDPIDGNSDPSNGGQGETGAGGFDGTNNAAGITGTSGTEGNAAGTGLNESGTVASGGEGGFGESGTVASGGEGGFGESGTVASGGEGAFGGSGTFADGGQGGMGDTAPDNGVNAGELDCSYQPCYDFAECMLIGMFGCGFTECVYLRPDTPFPFLGMCE